MHRKATRRENFARSVMGEAPDGTAGIGYQMDVFDALGMKAVFFIDPLPARLWGTAAIADIVEPVE